MHLQSPPARERLDKGLRFLEQERRGLEQLLQARVQASAPLAAAFGLLTRWPGCGPILAATLLAG